MGRMDRMARAVVSAGLCLGVLGVLGPLLATWSALPDVARVALLACGPLAAAGFAVAGVWRDYARQQGALVIDRATYVALTGDAGATDAPARRGP